MTQEGKETILAAVNAKADVPLWDAVTAAALVERLSFAHTVGREFQLHLVLDLITGKIREW